MANAKNYRIEHNGMGFPVGSIVPATAFPAGVASHVHIGSVSESSNPVNVELPDGLVEPTSAEGGKEVATARAELFDLSGKYAERGNRIDALEKELAGANVALAATTADRDEWKALAEQKDDNEGAIDPTKQNPDNKPVKPLKP